MITTIETMAESLSSTVNIVLIHHDLAVESCLCMQTTEDWVLAQSATHATQDHKMKPDEINGQLKSKISKHSQIVARTAAKCRYSISMNDI